MREILFRGKRKDNDEWAEGYYYHDKVMVDDTKNHDYIMGRTAGVYFKHWCVTDTIGQYTGLTDKNGTKIFEGDILAYCDTNGNEHIEGVVKYGKFNCSCCDGVYGWYIDDGDIRILDKDGLKWLDPYVKGNIHDNPELLKEGAEK